LVQAQIRGRSHSKSCQHYCLTDTEALQDTKASTKFLVIGTDTVNDKEALTHIAVIRFLYSGELPVANLSSIISKTENREYLCDFYHAAMIWAYKHGVNNALDHCGQRYAKYLSQLLDDVGGVCAFGCLRSLYTRVYDDADLARAFRTVALKFFKQQIDKLQKAGRFEEAIRRMEQNPQATADLFNGLRNEDGEIKPTTEWKCSGCEAVFRYSKEPKQHTMELTVCPCCTKTRKRSLEDGPLPEQKKAKAKS
jgi:hypothetical protein